MDLSSHARTLGYRLDARAVTGSTNDDAGAALRAGDQGKLWVVAERQETGRGRLGRAWTSPPGNLYASLALLAPCPMATAPQLGFLAGLALLDAARMLAPDRTAAFALKWPNDLLLSGAKCSGILLEGVMRADGVSGLVIGFGVNVTHAPGDAPYPVARLSDIAAGVTPDVALEALSEAVARRLAAFEAAEPDGRFARLREDWLREAAGRRGGARVRVRDGFRYGRVAGLDGHGRLLLETDTGVETIDAGDMTITAPSETA